ncbi:MAG TPA: flavin reductase family protein [Candidatus Cloacimonadota bacterium]|nr:flavin reductase family protein [Candidatus Cloacimonadota bacterium]HPT72283.1 flavin reductase family protein [Candidatus Cloacimonadota bacterium]
MEVVNLNKAYLHVHSPSKVAYAIVETPDGRYNPITIEWFMRTSIDPPMIAISIGLTRFSHECLQQSKYFNLCIPSDEMREEVMFCGTVSGKGVNKLEEIDAEWIPGKLHKLPVLKDAAANFECEIVTQVRSGDHTIFVGEVKYSWIDENRNMLLL